MAGVAAVLLVASNVSAARSQPPIVAAADALIASLSPSEAAASLAPFDSADRRRFRLTPGPRGGLALAAMDEGTRTAAFAFLEAALGHRGTTVVRTIIERERILGKIEGRPRYRDPDLYYLAIFGTAGDGRWGFRFEGHHLSLNHTYDGADLVAMAPLALGANPETHRAEGVPATVHTDIHELAAAIAAGGAGRLSGEAAAPAIAAMLRRLLSVAPEPAGGDYAAALTRRSDGGHWRFSADGFRLDGDQFTVALSGVSRNHIHIMLEDARLDFGGP